MNITNIKTIMNKNKIFPTITNTAEIWTEATVKASRVHV